MIKLKKVFHFIGLLSFSTLLIGCQHQARVDRWVEVPCQPHGFFIAFKGQSLADVAKICQIDEALLTQHNAWLTTRQPFTENTVVWLRTDPNAPIVEADLTVKGIDNATSPGFAAESLTPLVLPNRVVPAKPSVPRSSVR
jgi:hypothetical protein